jgi:hypothetical protein
VNPQPFGIRAQSAAFFVIRRFMNPNYPRDPRPFEIRVIRAIRGFVIPELSGVNPRPFVIRVIRAIRGFMNPESILH